MSATRIRLATRGSKLALIQAELVATALRRNVPQLTVTVVTVATAGDRDQMTPLRFLGGQGAFVGGVRQAILDGRADAAVHSLKDVPTVPAEGLVFAAMLERGDPRDALVSRGGALADQPAGARIGTGARRRVALVRMRRPDLTAAEIRGNVDTRIAKVMSGRYDGVILAAAGLQRLGRLGEATEVFDLSSFLPSPAQAVIALECRVDDGATRAAILRLDHPHARAAATAERGLLAAVGTGCDLAVGAYARVDDGRLMLDGMIGGDRDGTQPARGSTSGAMDAAEELGGRLGQRLQREFEARYGAL